MTSAVQDERVKLQFFLARVGKVAVIECLDASHPFERDCVQDANWARLNLRHFWHPFACSLLNRLRGPLAHVSAASSLSAFSMKSWPASGAKRLSVVVSCSYPPRSKCSASGMYPAMPP